MYSLMVGVVAAHRAGLVAAQLELPELHPQRVVGEQAAVEGVAPAEQELDRLRRLDDADDARQDPQHPRLLAARREVGRRRLGVEAAVAGPSAPGDEGGHLPLEAEDGAVHHGLVHEHGGVVDQVPRGEVVTAVDHHVEALEDALHVVAEEPLLEFDHLHVGVQIPDGLLGAVHLGHAHPRGGVEDLPLEVGRVDHVRVDQAQRAHARRRR